MSTLWNRGLLQQKTATARSHNRRGINLLIAGWIALAAGTSALDLILILLAVIVVAAILAGLGWVAALTRRLGRQMEVIGRQVEGEDALEIRYRLAHPHDFGPYNVGRYNFESAHVGSYLSNP